MARVARESLLIVDTVFMGDDIEAAEKLRDPSHVQNYTDAEWRGLVSRHGSRRSTTSASSRIRSTSPPG